MDKIKILALIILALLIGGCPRTPGNADRSSTHPACHTANSHFNPRDRRTD